MSYLDDDTTFKSGSNYGPKHEDEVATLININE